MPGLIKQMRERFLVRVQMGEQFSQSRRVLLMRALIPYYLVLIAMAHQSGAH
jgi:hypothetical protein